MTQTDEQQVVDLLVRHGFKARVWTRSSIQVFLFLDGEPAAHAAAIADLLNDAGWSATVTWDYREVHISTIHRYYPNPVVRVAQCPRLDIEA